MNRYIREMLMVCRRKGPQSRPLAIRSGIRKSPARFQARKAMLGWQQLDSVDLYFLSVALGGLLAAVGVPLLFVFGVF
jgi:hypothetical protein